MKVLIAPDKFKGSLSAHRVAEAIAKGIHRFDPTIDCILHPLADGGDGSLHILDNYLHFEKTELEVSGPLGMPVKAAYYRSGPAVFVEIADAAGLVLLAPAQRNPLLTTTLGVGELMNHAIEHGAKEIFLFLGGSATNDGGTGIAHALGFRFLDETGQVLQPIGKNLQHIRQIIPPPQEKLGGLQCYCLCDVQNTLLGKNGASHTYAAQKGASPADIEMLETGMTNFAQTIENQFNTNTITLPGGGAAGGIAAGLSGLLGSQIRSGIDTILGLTNFEEMAKTVDLIVSGEGKLDTQTLEGKVIHGVLRTASKFQKPALLVVGQSELDKTALSGQGVVDVLTLMSRSTSVEEACEKTAEIIEGLIFDFFVKNGHTLS